jgi:hypothetical protein
MAPEQKLALLALAGCEATQNILVPSAWRIYKDPSGASLRYGKPGGTGRAVWYCQVLGQAGIGVSSLERMPLNLLAELPDLLIHWLLEQPL